MTNKLHTILAAGFSGFAYSQREGFTTSFSVGIFAKYLFSENFFNELTLDCDMYNTKKPNKYLLTFKEKMGWQLNRKNSISISYKSIDYNIPRDWKFNTYGIVYLDEDKQSELLISHKFYWGLKNILGPELGYGFQNFEIGRHYYLKAGFHYVYVFY